MKKLLLLATLSLVAVGVAACSHELDQNQQNTAKLGALEFAGPNYQFISVSSLDSDGDGYVTATLRHVKTGENMQILCGYKSAGAGCKPKV